MVLVAEREEDFCLSSECYVTVKCSIWVDHRFTRAREPKNNELNKGEIMIEPKDELAEEKAMMLAFGKSIPFAHEHEPMALRVPKEGDGFVLRAFTKADSVPLAEIEFDLEVKQYLKQPDENAKAQWIINFDPDRFDGWAIEVGGRLAGRASILRAKRRGEGELAIVIARIFWGAKLGRRVAAMLIPAAFSELNAKALQAIVHPKNQASLVLLRVFKFRNRGTVNVEVDHWQAGHLLYRLTREAYNISIGSNL